VLALSRAEWALRRELAALRPSALRRRARAEGVADAALEEALDHDPDDPADPQRATIELVVGAVGARAGRLPRSRRQAPALSVLAPALCGGGGGAGGDVEGGGGWPGMGARAPMLRCVDLSGNGYEGDLVRMGGSGLAVLLRGLGSDMGVLVRQQAAGARPMSGQDPDRGVLREVDLSRVAPGQARRKSFAREADGGHVEPLPPLPKEGWWGGGPYRGSTTAALALRLLGSLAGALAQRGGAEAEAEAGARRHGAGAALLRWVCALGWTEWTDCLLLRAESAVAESGARQESRRRSEAGESPEATQQLEFEWARAGFSSAAAGALVAGLLQPESTPAQGEPGVSILESVPY
jgi:hypothetical protein